VQAVSYKIGKYFDVSLEGASEIAEGSRDGSIPLIFS